MHGKGPLQYPRPDCIGWDVGEHMRRTRDHGKYYHHRLMLATRSRSQPTPTRSGRTHAYIGACGTVSTPAARVRTEAVGAVEEIMVE
jgi:hypothetical protein